MISRNDYAVILRCAEMYKKELLDTNVLFIYQNRKTKRYEYIEATFLAANFKHLTGITYPKKNENKNEQDNTDGAAHFFNLAVNRRLDILKCNYKNDGTTALKLQILPMIMNIKRTARMIGDYNGSRMHIMADKMCGSYAATLALVNDRRYGYSPSSTIRDDIRNLVSEYHPIYAILQKSINESHYNRIFYKSKKFDCDNMPVTIKGRIVIQEK